MKEIALAIDKLVIVVAIDAIALIMAILFAALYIGSRGGGRG